jgi:hypothetical protein
MLIRIDQVSYARVMDKGTNQNILTELKMTSDQYNLVTTMYYVSLLELVKIHCAYSGRSPTSSQKPHPTFSSKASDRRSGKLGLW